MPIARFQMPDGRVARFEVPEGTTPEQAQSLIQEQVTQSQPQQDALPQSMTPKKEAPSGLGRGMRDPIDAGAQLLTHVLPRSVVDAGDKLNNWLASKGVPLAKIPERDLSSLVTGQANMTGVDRLIADQERAYQKQRAEAGETGFDWGRLAGNIVSPANIVAASKIPQAASLFGRVGIGAASGAAFGAAQPVTDGDFWTEKAKQAGLGSVVGGALPLLTGAASRIVSPKASTNKNLKVLQEEGIQPTIGQTLGGRVNALEEKLQSVPIAGDMIAKARGRAVQQFNKAAINRAVAPIGEKVDDVGSVGVKEAGDLISQAYDDALSKVKVVKFDNQFAQDVTQLKSMSRNLVPDMRKKFDKVLSDTFGTRVSGAGSMFGETFKKVDSEIGKMASRYKGSGTASEQELGDALLQLQNLLKQQAQRSNPDFSKAMSAADEAWANLVRVEGAAKNAVNSEGVFTPGQLNQAIKTADKSVRKRATARGTALMQDLSQAGQSVLGNKVPNSFTADRLLYGGGALGSYMLNPLIPASLLTGGAMYTAPMQKLLNAAVASRPESAVKAAEIVRQSAPFIAPGAIGLLNSSQY